MASRYQIVIDDPVQVAGLARDGIATVRNHRRSNGDAYFFKKEAKSLNPFSPALKERTKRIVKVRSIDR